MYCKADFSLILSSGNGVLINGDDLFDHRTSKAAVLKLFTKRQFFYASKLKDIADDNFKLIKMAESSQKG